MTSVATDPLREATPAAANPASHLFFDSSLVFLSVDNAPYSTLQGTAQRNRKIQTAVSFIFHALAFVCMGSKIKAIATSCALILGSKVIAWARSGEDTGATLPPVDGEVESDGELSDTAE